MKRPIIIFLLFILLIGCGTNSEESNDTDGPDDDDLIENDSADLIADHNILTDDPGLVDPANTDYLLKDFSLLDGSTAIDGGTAVPVWDDFIDTERPQDTEYDLGAFER
jgi:hypothetical protein